MRYIYILMIVSFISCTKKEKAENKKFKKCETIFLKNEKEIGNENDTILFEMPVSFGEEKRIVYGNVKSLEEKSYKYFPKSQNKPEIKERYHGSDDFGNSNYIVEFDTIGRIDYFFFSRKKRTPADYKGSHYKYDNEGKITKLDVIMHEDYKGYRYVIQENEFTYTKNSVKKSELGYHVNYGDTIVEYKTNYLHNKKGDIIKSLNYNIEDNENEVLDKAEDFERDITKYKYDRKGRIIEKTKNSRLYKFKYDTLNEKQITNLDLLNDSNNLIQEISYYSTSIPKKIKLRNSEIEYNKTGDVIKHNGKKITRFLKYDLRGNWIQSIKEVPYPDRSNNRIYFLYTERLINYYSNSKCRIKIDLDNNKPSLMFRDTINLKINLFSSDIKNIKFSKKFDDYFSYNLNDSGCNQSIINGIEEKSKYFNFKLIPKKTGEFLIDKSFIQNDLSCDIFPVKTKITIRN